MASSEENPSRPRRYAFGPVEGVAHGRAAYYLAALNEFTERHLDLLRDLPEEVLGWVPTPGWYSAAQITAHQAQAECFWIGRATDAQPSDELTGPLETWRRGGGEVPSPEQLAAACRAVRRWTIGRVAPLEDIDVQRPGGGGLPVSVRGALLHLLWHWTYHSGQVGLIRGLTGREYRWNFDDPVIGSIHDA